MSEILQEVIHRQPNNNRGEYTFSEDERNAIVKLILAQPPCDLAQVRAALEDAAIEMVASNADMDSAYDVEGWEGLDAIEQMKAQADASMRSCKACIQLKNAVAALAALKGAGQ